MLATKYLEKQVLKQLVTDILAAGYSISIGNGENMVVRKSIKKTDILAALRSVFEEHLYVHEPVCGNRIGWVTFVYGKNDIKDMINDYSVNLEVMLANTWKLIDEMQGIN
jgi:hypothetical protein